MPIILEDGTISFTWRDGPILKAIKEKHWVLLDEMNLGRFYIFNLIILNFSVPVDTRGSECLL